MVLMTKQERCAGLLRRWARGLIWQLPEQPYPSEHPWSQRHGGTPVG
jgi:hypothetical protein